MELTPDWPLICFPTCLSAIRDQRWKEMTFFIYPRLSFLFALSLSFSYSSPLLFIGGQKNFKLRERIYFSIVASSAVRFLHFSSAEELNNMKQEKKKLHSHSSV